MPFPGQYFSSEAKTKLMEGGQKTDLFSPREEIDLFKWILNNFFGTLN